MRRFPNAAYGLAATALLMATACSGDSTSPKNSLSPAEARAVASALFSDIARAVGSPTPSSASIAPANQSAGVPTTVSATVNGNCSGGGTIHGTFGFNSDVNTAGTGTLSGSVTVAASQCVVSTGQRAITTDGSYTYTFSASLVNNALSSNFVWKAGGTFTWTGGSCTLDYTVTVTPQGSKSLSGTICGVDVTGTIT
jgi:hypothetical protein